MDAGPDAPQDAADAADGAAGDGPLGLADLGTLEVGSADGAPFGDASSLVVLDLDDWENSGPPPPVMPWRARRSSVSLALGAFTPGGPEEVRFELDAQGDALVTYAIEAVARDQQSSMAGFTTILSGRGQLFALDMEGAWLAWGLRFEDRVAVTLADGRVPGSERTFVLPLGEPDAVQRLGLQLNPAGGRALLGLGCEIWLLDAAAGQPIPVAVPPGRPGAACEAGSPFWLDDERALVMWRAVPEDGGPPSPPRFARLDPEGGAEAMDRLPGFSPPPPGLDRSLCVAAYAPGAVVLSWPQDFCGGDLSSPAVWRTETDELVALPAAEGAAPVPEAERLGRFLFEDLWGERTISYALDGTDERVGERLDVFWFGVALDIGRGRFIASQREGRNGRIVAIDPATLEVEPISAPFGAPGLWVYPCPDATCVVADGGTGWRLDLPGGPEVAPVPIAPPGVDPGQLVGVAGPSLHAIFIREDADASTAWPLRGGAPILIDHPSPFVTSAGLVMFRAEAETALLGAGPGGDALTYSPAGPWRVRSLEGDREAGPWVVSKEDGTTFEAGFDVVWPDARPPEALPVRAARLLGVIGGLACFARSGGGLEIWDVRGEPRRLPAVATPELSVAFLISQPPMIVASTADGTLLGLPLDPEDGSTARSTVELAPGRSMSAFVLDAGGGALLAMDGERRLWRAALDPALPPEWRPATDPLPGGNARFRLALGGRVLIWESLGAAGDMTPLMAFDVSGESPGAQWPVAPPGYRAGLSDAEGERLMVVRPDGRVAVARTTGEDAAGPPPLVARADVVAEEVRSIGPDGQSVLVILHGPDDTASLATASLAAPGPVRPLTDTEPGCCVYARLTADAALIGLHTGGAGAPALDLVRLPLDPGPARTLRLPGLSPEDTRVWSDIGDDATRWLALTAGDLGLLVPLDFEAPHAPWHIRSPDAALLLDPAPLADPAE